MKKTILFLALTIICLSLSASQFLYRQSSDEAQTLFLLAKLSGTALPDVTWPVSANTLNLFIELIDKTALSEENLSVLTELSEKIQKKNFLVSVKDTGFALNASVLALQTWTRETSFKDRIPLLSLNTDIQITDNFASEIDFDLKAAPYNKTDISSNFSFLSPFNLFKDLSHQFPTRAYASIGNSFLNLSIGRDKLSAGNGITGNLELGENFLYQDFAKLSISKNPLSYDFSILAWDNPTNEKEVSRYNGTDPYKAAFIHRFSAIFAKKITASVYEGAIIYASNAFSDIRTLNPFMMIHNTYTYDNGNINNFFGVEINSVLPKGFSVTFQSILDQFKLSDETDDSGEPAFGILFNIQNTLNIGNGILNSYAEFVYSSRYLYLKEYENQFTGNVNSSYYQIDMIGVNKFFSAQDEQNYIGYTYGSDVSVFALGASYLYNKRQYSVDLMFKNKGKYGIGENETRAIRKTEEIPSEKTFSLILSTKGHIIKGIDYEAKLGIVNINNLNHIPNASNKDKFSFSASVTVNPLELIDNQKKNKMK